MDSSAAADGNDNKLDAFWVTYPNAGNAVGGGK